MIGSSEIEEKRSIQGRTREWCVKNLDKQYGHDSYQILSSSMKFCPGFLGFFQHETIILEYVVKKSSEQSAEKKAEPLAYKSGGISYAENSVPSPAFTQTVQIQQPAVRNSFVQQRDFLQSRDDFLEKTSSVSAKNALQMGQLSNQISRQLERFENELSSKMNAIIQSSAEKDVESIVRIRELLEENEFSKSYIENMCARIKQNFTLDELDDFDLIERSVVDWIGESIPCAEKEKKSSPQVVIIVGPTGVGKTTTVAKMGTTICVNYKNNRGEYEKKPVIRMITTDTMRVAAVEQLARWASILEVDVAKAENSDDLKNLCDDYSKNSDYIFIDTSGYSPNDYENIAKMRRILDVKNLNECVYLAVTAGVSSKDFENIIRNYEAFDFKSVIITKCDETASFGRVLSVVAEKQKKISWITTGQDVLNTIQRANPVWFLKKLSGFRVDADHIEEKFGTADKETEKSI
jgi:flagellar biosynthesis protein FlhF